MRWILFFLFVISTYLASSQEKFLKLSIKTQHNNSTLKPFLISVSCEEDISFQLVSKKKKLSFYLAPGFKYKLIISKDGYFQSNYVIDLTSVPKALYQDNFVEYRLTDKLVERSAIQPTKVHQLTYDDRTGKLKTID